MKSLLFFVNPLKKAGILIFSTFLGLLFTVDPIFSYSQEILYLRPRANVSSPKVPLSKIVVLPKGIEDEDIMDIPESPINITPEKLEEILPERLSSYRVLGSKCQIIPFGLKFESKELEESLLKEIIKRNSINIEDYRLTYLEDIANMPLGVELKWGNFPKDLGAGSRIFTLNAYFNNSKIYSKRLKFKVEKKYTVAVLKRGIPRFTILTENDYYWKKLYLDEPITDFVTTDIKGMALLSKLEEGSFIKKKHIRLVHAVEKGTEVEVYITAGNLTVKSKAIAKKAGNPGDLIEMKSKTSGVLLKGIVKGRGLVEIQ
ncbi:MAG: flagellar basal body P-ring formation protein FlgA [Leptospiraceae bacterium]|nr:flagellar basal body P-ring formation protein FlgA [Leptospiraceae bacterium]